MSRAIRERRIAWQTRMSAAASARISLRGAAVTCSREMASWPGKELRRRDWSELTMAAASMTAAALSGGRPDDFAAAATSPATSVFAYGRREAGEREQSRYVILLPAILAELCRIVHR